MSPLEPGDLIGNAAVRELCGGITRHTLIAWRRDLGFPEPAVTVDRTECWDRRVVLAWLKQNRPQRYRQVRRRK